jgi:hypothetical protein
MSTVKNTQTRKTGDTLRLSGTLTGALIPTADADWVDAVAVINIVADKTLVPYRIADPVTLDTTAGARRYSYEGAPPAVDDVGVYLYEIEVTFADETTTTFPDSDDKYRLRIVAELG